MSLVISPLIGFWLNFTTFGVSEHAHGRRAYVFVLLSSPWPAATDAYAARQNGSSSTWPRRRAPSGRALAADKTAWTGRHCHAAVAVALFVIVTAASRSRCRSKGEQYTEFYLYGNNSTIAEYPLSCNLGDTKPVIVGIANHEGTVMTYNLAVTIDGIGSRASRSTRSASSSPTTSTVEKTINLTMNRAGDHLNMQFLLYVDGVPDTPYRACNLWVDVKAPANATLPANVSALL